MSKEQTHLILKEEAWTDDEDPKFAFTVYIWQSGEQFFHLRRDEYRGEPSPERLFSLASRIPDDYFRPFPSPGMTKLAFFDEQDPQAKDRFFFKRPALSDFELGAPNRVAANVLHEASICERLMVAPHPNVCRYFGYHSTTGGRIDALCFEKHVKDLRAAVRQKDLFDVAHVIDGIREGLKHLHSLNIVHNDINAFNVVLTKSGDAVLIDFDSCWQVGEELKGKKVGVDADISLPENDEQAVIALEDWLTAQMASIISIRNSEARDENREGIEFGPSGY
ncbi:hypothetical protein DL96DRAFT_1501095 [Flagelloscypha sp. PMI_526]|nr:hypothetical protein DL96DRAFT_1501095 [Flagelloscypha sp. PMI_526]